MHSISSVTLTTGEQVPLTTLKTACVFYWGLIGDVFVRVAIIEALKTRFPDLQITAVVDPSSKAVLIDHPAVASVVVFSRHKRPLWRYVFNTMQLVMRLRRRHFDLSINLYSGGASPQIVHWVNARVRLGFDHTAALRKSNNLLVKHPTFCDNWTKAFAQVLTPLGITNEQVRRGTSFHVSPAAKLFASEFFAGDGHCYIVYNLGAGVAEKRWPVENFLALAHSIEQRYQLTPLILTNPGMAELAAAFAVGYQSYGHCRIVPQLELAQVAAIIQHCNMIVTGDTSIMHLAFGLKVPTLVLFTYTRPEIVDPEDCLHVDCFIEDPSNINDCGRPSGTVAIPVDYVLSQFQHLFDQTTTGAPR